MSSCTTYRTQTNKCKWVSSGAALSLHGLAMMEQHSTTNIRLIWVKRRQRCHLQDWVTVRLSVAESIYWPSSSPSAGMQLIVIMNYAVEFYHVSPSWSSCATCPNSLVPAKQEQETSAIMLGYINQTECIAKQSQTSNLCMFDNMWFLV